MEIVSRDRYANYSNAVTNASAGIIQVADRWHLLKNLGDALQKVLDRNYLKLKACREKELRELQSIALKESQSLSKAVSAEDTKRRKLERKFEQVKKLLSEGHSISEVFRRTKVARNTIKKWRHFEVLPLKNGARHTKMYLYFLQPASFRI